MKKFWKYFGRVMACVGALLGLVIILIVGTVLILCYGPSKTAKNLFVNSALESSVGKTIMPWMLGEEALNEMAKENSVEETTEVTDPDLIQITTETQGTEGDPVEEKEPIEIIYIEGASYNGVVALVHDSSRVSVGVSGPFGPSYGGRTVKAMADEAGAILAVNGGGFEDAGGVGNGGTPLGMVIQDGKLTWGSLTSSYDVIGFDYNNRLILGRMTGQQALDRGLKSALCYGPFLIVNGKPASVSGFGSGVNPRTAIGQAEDGTIILVVTDGRQPNSLGATMTDLINIMTEYGAVNAANLDGGSSTIMYYKGEYLNHHTSLYGPRAIPTCILVK